MRVLLAISLLIGVSSAGAKTLDNIKKNGVIKCGVSTGASGFSAPNSKGQWFGLDVDFCRSLSAAVFGDPNKVKFVPLSAQQRFTALQSGEVDILSRNTTRNLTRDTKLGLNFAPVMYYDGQAFIVKSSLKAKSVKDLDGATVCTQQGTTTEQNLASYFRQHKLKLRVKVFESNEESVKTFVDGACDAYTTDKSGLAILKIKYKNINHRILPEIISKEPLAPVVRHGDDQWFDIVTWTVYALIGAEEMGLTSKNIQKHIKSHDLNIRKFVGTTKGNGKALGLSSKWAYNIVKHVGNYGELFKRNLGKDSPMKIERGLNKLWTQGGLMYAPPLK